MPNKIRTTLLCTLLLCFHATGIMAQVGTLFNSAQKLSSSFVKEIYQDHQGFIWASTDNGLNRYDGYSFLTFNATDGLCCDNINSVIQGRNGNIYAGTATGLCEKINGRFQLVKEQNTRNDFRAHIVKLMMHKDSTVYIATSGAGLWVLNNNDMVQPLTDDLKELQYSRQVVIDRNGIIWVATDFNGVFALKKNTKNKKNSTSPYTIVGRYKPRTDCNYPCILMDNKGDLYIGLYNGGVYTLPKGKNELELLPGTMEFAVSSIGLGVNGRILIGTNGNGLKVFDPSTKELLATKIFSHLLDLQKTKVFSILLDKDQNLWLGLLQKGVFMQPPFSKEFKCMGTRQGKENIIGEACTMSIFKQRNGTLWVSGDQDGVYKLDANNKLLTHMQGSVSSSKSTPSTILDICEDNDGKLWVGTYTQGCGWIDSNSGEYHRLDFSYGRAQSVFDIKKDYLGRMWFGTLGDGLKCLDTKTGKVTEQRNINNNPKMLVNNYVLEMFISNDGKRLYAGTATGLSCLDIPSGSWTKIFKKAALFEGEAIKSIRESAKSGLWVGTSKGAYNVNLKTMEITHYSVAEGMPSNDVGSIEIDSEENVWISTHNGLCRFDYKTKAFSSYYVSDGLQGNEYNDGVSFYDRKNNIIYFGGTEGISFFNPSEIRYSRKPYSITLTKLTVGGERVLSFMESGGYIVCRKAVSMADHFDFCHQDNSFSIYLSTLSYSGIEHITYSYRINGEQWINLPAGENVITLSRLDPGDYDFEIIANDNGNKSEVKKFTIVVHNPWYFTPMARVIYFLFVLFAIGWYLQIMRIRNQQKLDLQQHIHAEQLNEQKLQFFINMSHEIRTPMTLIITPLLQLMKEDLDSHRHAVYEIIKRNSERILHLVNQIMDLRKIDQGQMLMQMRETDMVRFTKNVMDLFSLQATNRRIAFSLDNAEDRMLVWIDRSQFDKILMNLLSNAFKYTTTGGKIRVSLTSSENTMSITVYNSGEKIPEASLERIFERFYQTTSTVNSNKIGTGIGLDLTRSLVQMHHGDIFAQNSDDGVEFIVTIPLGNSHLQPEEIAPSYIESEDTSSIDAELQASQEEENQDDTKTSEMIKRSQSKRATIVIVEDDDEIRNYLMAELSNTYRILPYSNGAEALPSILREIPQMVISDIMMPEMDGTTLCTRIKSNVNTNHIPVILLTAKTRDEDKLEGLETGADLYVTKPFNLDILRRSIANLLNSRKLMLNKFTGKEEPTTQIDDIKMETADEKLLARIMTVINNNLNNSDLNIDMICTEVGISRVHLHRKMKELTNQTPHDFIRNLRLKQAARLLSRKGQNITEVMYRCGFNSSTSFSTMFKKMYGMSPREYMKEHEGD